MLIHEFQWKWPNLRNSALFAPPGRPAGSAWPPTSRRSWPPIPCSGALVALRASQIVTSRATGSRPRGHQFAASGPVVLVNPQTNKYDQTRRTWKCAFSKFLYHQLTFLFRIFISRVHGPQIPWRSYLPVSPYGFLTYLVMARHRRRKENRNDGFYYRCKSISKCFSSLLTLTQHLMNLKVFASCEN